MSKKSTVKKCQYNDNHLKMAVQPTPETLGIKTVPHTLDNVLICLYNELTTDRNL
jgi:hypothetical protein